MKHRLGIIAVLLLMLVSSAFADVVLYREVFPYMGTWPDNATRFGRSITEGWIAYRSSSMLQGPGVNNANNVMSVFGEDNPAAPSDGAQVNSVPLGTPIAQATSDGQVLVSTNNVGIVCAMTSEYNFNFADATRIQFDDRSSNGVGRRVLLHLAGQDSSLWWVSNDTVTQPNPSAPTWVTLGVSLTTTSWLQVSLYDGSNQSTDYTGVTATTLSGTVDSFGLWENNPGSGNRRFDNYMILGIPEPATMSLLGVGVLGFIGRRKK